MMEKLKIQIREKYHETPLTVALENTQGPMTGLTCSSLHAAWHLPTGSCHFGFVPFSSFSVSLYSSYFVCSFLHLFICSLVRTFNFFFFHLLKMIFVMFLSLIKEKISYSLNALIIILYLFYFEYQFFLSFFFHSHDFHSIIF